MNLFFANQSCHAWYWAWCSFAHWLNSSGAAQTRSGFVYHTSFIEKLFKATEQWRMRFSEKRSETITRR